MKRVKRKNYREKLPENTKFVGRPSRWGNPYKVGPGHYMLNESLRLYRTWLKEKLQSDPDFLEPLRGKDLACYCDLDVHCHADILLAYFI